MNSIEKETLITPSKEYLIGPISPQRPDEIPNEIQGEMQTREDGSKTPPPLAPAVMPELFCFQDYRKFLKEWFEYKKRVQPGYSGALFARQAGLSSHTLLGMVIRGERNLGYETIRSFIKALNLKAREKIYFEKLVLFNQAKSSEDRADYFEQLVTLAQGEGRGLLTQIQDYAKYLSHWYTAAVHELVNLDDFKADPDWIVRKLKRKITAKEATDAWALLLQLGMVKLNPVTGRFEVTNKAMDFDPGTVSFAIRNFHKEFLDRAKDAIDHESLEERELSSLTIALSEKELGELRQKVKEFRKAINLAFSTGAANEAVTPEKKHVVSVNTQVLLLTENQSRLNNQNREKKEKEIGK
ncbi:MAG: TIGR02147 family protein [Bdellovibrionota bacterium]